MDMDDPNSNERKISIDSSSMSSSGSISQDLTATTNELLYMSDILTNDKKKKAIRSNEQNDLSQNSCSESNHSEIIFRKSPPRNINASSIDHQTFCVSDQTSDKKYRPQKFCAVCGDRAIACNFNAVTCESCKAFFRRNAFKEKLKCLFGDKCVIDKVTRRFCSRCRLKKCIEIGMKREWILSDEQKYKKRMKIIQNRQKKTDTNSNDESKDAGEKTIIEKKDASTSCPDETDLMDGTGPAFFFCPHDCLNCKNIVIAKTQTLPDGDSINKNHVHGNLCYSYNSEMVQRNTINDAPCSCPPDAAATFTIPDFNQSNCVTCDSANTEVNSNDCDQNAEAYDLLVEEAGTDETCKSNLFFINSTAIYYPNNLLTYDGGKSLFACPCVNDGQVRERLSSIDIHPNELRRINELLEASKFIFEPNNDTNILRTEGGNALENLVQMCDYSLRTFIQTIKQINAFKILSMDDQIALLKTACFKILILRSTHTFCDNICGWRDIKSKRVLSLEVLKQAKKSSVYEKHRSLLMTFDRPLREDRITVAILCMILLFDNAGYSNLESGSAIHAEHLNYLSSLKAYLLCVHPEPLMKYEKLMLTLTQINETNEEYNKFFSKDFQPAQITPLIVELFDLGTI